MYSFFLNHNPVKCEFYCQELQKELDKMKTAYDKRGDFLRSTKMIVKFRDSTIAKLEGKLKETKEEQIVSTAEIIFIGCPFSAYWTYGFGQFCNLT